MPKKLRVFLCHASEDKPAVRELYKRLASEPWIEPWLDEEDLLPGQDWNLEINKATREADAIIICMSKLSVEKEGYLNKEIRRVLDISDEKLEGAIYIIPLRLDDCSPSFERLKQIHYADYFRPRAHERLLMSLRMRADALKIETSETKASPVVAEPQPVPSQDDDLDLFRFIEIPPQEDSKVDYPFWIGKYLVTNAQYERFLNAPDFSNPLYWLEFSKFDENCKPIGNWGTIALDWLKEQLDESQSKVLMPRHWDDKDFGITNPKKPVVGISWYEANAYCEWLLQNWASLEEGKANPVKPEIIRLPLETEWVAAAGGEEPEGRYPWDKPGHETTLLKDKIRRANIKESGIGHTTAVDVYPLGKSPFGVMDMVGNIWEWQANYSRGSSNVNGHSFEIRDLFSLHGGSWYDDENSATGILGSISGFQQISRGSGIGFRVVALHQDVSS